MTRLWRLLPLLGALALDGCAVPQKPGISGRDAELLRQQGQTRIAVLETRPERAVILARGNRIIVKPVEAYCLDSESVSVKSEIAFAMIAECLGSGHGQAAAGGAAGPAPPRIFPGILTISVSIARAVGTARDDLDAFEKLLTSPEGLGLLGRGGGDAPGEVVAVERIGGALYVLVEESPGADSILAPRFWRAFAGINDRLVLVTVRGFKDRRVADGEMLGFLARQMQTLRKANRMAPSAEEARIAAETRRFYPGEATAGKVEPTVIGRSVAAVDPASVPASAEVPERPRRADVPRPGHSAIPMAAPMAAPAAPARRG